MDYSPESSLGQQNVSISAASVAKIAQQCELLQMLRGWYSHFDRSLRQVDEAAAIKAHDLIVDGAVVSTQVARELGITLPEVTNMNWGLSARVTRPSGPVDL